MQVKTKHIKTYGKPIVFITLCLPAIWLVWQWWLYFQGMPNGLGFNPQEASNRFSGIWALRSLILALAVSPFAKLIKKPWPILFRRMIGLFAFFYACLHLGSYIGLDLLLDWAAFWRDVKERIYILFGVGTIAALLPLAITSTNGWVKRLGARRWKALHRLAYIAGILGGLHFLFLAKGNQPEPKVYACIILFLLGLRLVEKARSTSWKKKKTAMAMRG